MTRTFVLLAALAALTGALLEPAPPASAQPVITVTPVLDPSDPQQVPQAASTGPFGMGKHGAITFRSARGKVVQRGTVMRVGRPLPGAVHGTCRAGQRGIWLILSGRKANHPDGNLLRLVGRPK